MAEAERQWDLLGGVKTELLVDPLVVTLAEKRAETLDETNSFTVEAAVVNTLGDTSAM